MRSLMLALVFGVVSCGPLRPPPYPIDPGDTAQCPVACENLSLLGCPEGEPLADGTSCTEFCVRTQEQGHALNPTCLAKITSCDQVDSCSVNREGGR